ncbi:MAG: helix-turn-helix domain-containing protein [Planctomycetaceae bacterium]|nr:helix-turn-helix domain-containing protein [Planctomycetaceae bacterium]
MERARRLLADTDLSTQAVALRAGFADYRQMAFTFRKELGQTPTAYRRRVRGRSDDDESQS